MYLSVSIVESIVVKQMSREWLAVIRTSLALQPPLKIMESCGVTIWSI